MVPFVLVVEILEEIYSRNIFSIEILYMLILRKVFKESHRKMI